MGSHRSDFEQSHGHERPLNRHRSWPGSQERCNPEAAVRPLGDVPQPRANQIVFFSVY
jgi:hypothetical protein